MARAEAVVYRHARRRAPRRRCSTRPGPTASPARWSSPTPCSRWTATWRRSTRIVDAVPPARRAARARRGPRRARPVLADPTLDGVDVLRVGTLSKTLGSLGGFVAGPRRVRRPAGQRGPAVHLHHRSTPADAAAGPGRAGASCARAEGDALRARLRGHVERLAPGHPSPDHPGGGRRRARRGRAWPPPCSMPGPARAGDPPADRAARARSRLRVALSRRPRRRRRSPRSTRAGRLDLPIGGHRPADGAVSGAARPARLVVVVGTGTEVGKTWVAAQLLDRRSAARGRRVAARKPAQSFDRPATPATDAGGAGRGHRRAGTDVCPAHRCYEVPMAPPMAAEALGRPRVHPRRPGRRARSGPTRSTSGWSRPPAASARRSRPTTTPTRWRWPRRSMPDVVVLVADAGLGTINRPACAETRRPGGRWS